MARKKMKISPACKRADKKKFKVVSIDDYEVEWDDDRSYNPSINFILK